MKDGTKEAPPMVKESIKKPKRIPATTPLKGPFLSEKGNNHKIGQHGETPYISNQLGDIRVENGRKMPVRKNNKLRYLLFITSQDLDPINSFWRSS